MSEDGGAATPATDVAPVKVTDEKSAVARVSQLLNPQATQEQPRPTTRKEPEAPVEESEAADKQSAEAEAEESQDAEAEAGSEEQAEQEFPETLEAIAEALGADPAKLLEQWKTRVKVDGEDREVTLSEALKGYSREADYLRKTELLANQRKDFEAQSRQSQEQFNQRLTQLSDIVTVLGNQFQGMTDANLMKILDEHGVEAYTRAKAYRDAQGQALAQAFQTLQAERQKAIEESQLKIAQQREREQALLAEALPVFKDPAKGLAYESSVKSYLEKEGYSRSDIESFFKGAFDHRQVKIIDKAMKWDALKHEKTDLKAKLAKLPAPKTVKPQGKVEEGPADKVEQLRERLRKPNQTRRQAERNSVALVKGLMSR